MTSKKLARLGAGRVVVLYAAFAAAWILLSDQALLLLNGNVQRIAWVGTAKGGLFVALTSLLLYGLLAREARRLSRFEATLRESEETLRLFIEHAPAAIAMFDREMRYLAVSRRWVEDYSVAERDVIGRSHYEIFPEVPEQWRAVHRRALAGEVVQTDEDRFVRADGRVQWLRWEVRPWAVAGQVGGILIMSEDISSRKLAELERQRTDARYRALIDQAAPDAMYVHDHDGRLIEVNRRACEELGYSRDELLAMNVAELERNADLPTMQEAWAHIEPGSSISVIGRHQRKDGSCFPVEIHFGLQVFDGQRFYITLARNIEERLRAEERMRILSAAVEQNPHSVLITDPQTRIVYVNEAFVRCNGYGREDVIGQPADMLGGDVADPETLRRLHAAVEAGLPWQGEFRNRRRDGRIEIDYAHIAPVRDAEGRVTHFVSVQEEITERKAQAEELDRHRHHLEDLVAQRTADLVAAEAHLRLLFEFSADGVIELDRLGNVMLVNPAASALLGYSPEALRGRNVHEAIHYQHPDGRPYPARDCSVVTAVLTGETVRQEFDVFWRADGSPLPVSVATHPIRREGEVLGAVMNFSDASERRRIDAERERARAEAERLARIKSEFLANMSHEIRTPLNGVLGLARIGYRDSAGHEAARQTFARILDSGKLLLTVINDILDFSKIEAGKLDIEARAFDPAALAGQVAGALAPSASSRGLRLETDLASDLPPACLGDSVRISQILLNLLSNALKFTPSGKVRLCVRRDDERLVFDVADSGIGIAAADLARLFQPFEQVDGSTTRKYGGTGLGLAISRRLAQLMEGELLARSEPGKGSTFTLRLPLRPTDTAPDAAANPGPAVLPEPVALRLAGRRILVAEDNEVNQLVIEDMLRREGAEVVLVGNGRLAVEAVTTGQYFDVVLMDVQMPEMDGIEATRRLRDVAPALPVIGQTAHAMPEEQQRCIAAGMQATVTKPIDPENLVAAVLQRSQPPARALAPAAAAPAGPVDWVALLARFPRRPEFVERLAQLGVESTEGVAERLSRAATNGDHATIAELAHSLKGMAGNLLARELEILATSTMTAARDGLPSALVAAIELGDRLEALRDVLRRGPAG